jgi:superfamily II DNA or RNA helicase
MAVKVILGNRTARFLCGWEEQIRLKDRFSYLRPGYRFSQRYRSGEWDGTVCLMRRGCVASGLFLDRRALLEGDGFRFEIDDRRQAPKFTDHEVPGLRDYQRDCVEAMINASSTGGLVLCATGSGKTFMAAAYFSRLIGRGCFVVDELTLLEQARREMEKVTGEDVGMVGRSEFRPGRMTAATVQTLHRHSGKDRFREWFRSLDVLVIDEIHVALNRRTIDVVRAVAPKAVFGLTATLEIEKDDIRLRAAALAGPPIFEYGIGQGVAEGRLSHGEVVQVVFRRDGMGADYQSEYRRMVSHSKARNSVVEEVVRAGVSRGRKVIVLVERLAHLRILSRRLRDVPHCTLSGKDPQEDRLRAKDAMDDDQLLLILASRIFGRGIDIRKVDMIVDATATRSRSGAIQRYGRGIRTAAGKRPLLFVDIGDDGPPHGHPGWNRFASCSRSRMGALASLGLPVRRADWDGGASGLFGLAVVAA